MNLLVKIATKTEMGNLHVTECVCCPVFIAGVNCLALFYVQKLPVPVIVASSTATCGLARIDNVEITNSGIVHICFVNFQICQKYKI